MHCMLRQGGCGNIGFSKKWGCKVVGTERKKNTELVGGARRVGAMGGQKGW